MAWAYLILAAEVLAFWRQVIFSAKFSIPWDLPYYHQHLAWFAARSLARGELPLWDPYTYCGSPAYANLTMQLFYPPTLAVIAVSNATGGRHLLYLLEWQIVLHVLAGGVFTLMLLRKLGAGMPAALAGATVYQLGAYFASQAQHLGAMDAAAWLPLAWLAVLELTDAFSWRWLGILAAALALAFLAGFPAATVVVWGSTFLVAVTQMVVRRAGWRMAVWCTGAAALAAVLSAVQLLPTVELNRWSVSALRSDWTANGGGIPLAALWSLIWADSFGVLHFTDGHWRLPWNATFMYVYCGVPALIFAAAALVRRRRHPAAAVFASVAAISALWMLGDSTPVYRSIYRWLPGTLQGALYSEFALSAFTLALAVVAGLGANDWLKHRSRGVQALVVAAIAVDLTVCGSGRPFNTARVERGQTIAYDNYDGHREVPGRMRELVGGNVPPWRVDTMNGSIDWAGSASLFEVPTANGNEPFALRRFMEVRRLFTGGERWGRYYEVRDPDSRVLKLLNVRYVISRAALPAPGGLIERETLAGNVVYENGDPAPRFFMVRSVRAASGMEDAARVLGSAGFDPRVEAVVEGGNAPARLPSRQARLPAPQVVRYRAGEVVLDVDMDADGFLVSSEAYYPGWKASVDGREAELVLTNVAFRGLAVPAGRHRVRMWFNPGILKWSGAVSLVGLGLLAAMMTRKRAG